MAEQLVLVLGVMLDSLVELETTAMVVLVVLQTVVLVVLDQPQTLLLALMSNIVVVVLLVVVAKLVVVQVVVENLVGTETLDMVHIQVETQLLMERVAVVDLECGRRELVVLDTKA
jgi:hypothetical protein